MKKVKRKLDELTQAVLTCRRRKTNQLMVFIREKSDRLIYPVMKFYYMEYFPKLIQEDIIEECQTIVLLRAIKDFDVKKKAKFSTYYTWKIKSYVHGKHLYYLRRKYIVEHASLNQVHEEGATLENVLTNFNTRYKAEVSKKIRNIFGCK